ncbi:MAG: hypothetical protein AB9891_15750 [Anaerolineaceae bacterium]
MNENQMNDLIEMGILLVGSGQAAEARSYFSKAVKINPDSAYAWYYLGAVMHDPEKKRYCFSRAVSLDADIHQKVIRANAQRTSMQVETESAKPQMSDDPAIDEDEDTPTDREIEPEMEPEIKNETVALKRRLSLFVILLSILILVLILLSGAAYWMIALR